MKVAAIQFCPTWKDKPGNIRRAGQLVIEAAAQGARLIVLPELCTTGYGFMSKADAEPFAEVLTEFQAEEGRLEKSMNAMFTLAKRLGVHVVWGLVEKDYGTGHLYNSQVLMCPSGRYESMRKVNRWGNDFLWAQPGRSNPPILPCDLGEGVKKVGLLICRDVRDKKDSHWDSFYEKGDADIVCLSANWGDGGFPATTWMEFVEDNNTTLIVANRYGQEGPNDFGEGGSCVIRPPDLVSCEGLAWSQDCIVLAEV